MLSDWVNARDQVSIVALFDRIINDTGYEPYINDQSEEGNDRWENVQELRRLAYDFEEKGLTDFLQNLALVSDQDTLPAEGAPSAAAQAGAVTLLTLHAAKGLEFNQVFIIGLDEGLLPHSRSRDDPEEMAEERRLFYVGMTRAKHSLTGAGGTSRQFGALNPRAFRVLEIVRTSEPQPRKTEQLTPRTLLTGLRWATSGGQQPRTGGRRSLIRDALQSRMRVRKPPGEGGAGKPG